MIIGIAMKNTKSLRVEPQARDRVNHWVYVVVGHDWKNRERYYLLVRLFSNRT